MYPANSFTIKFVMPVSSELAVALQLHSYMSVSKFGAFIYVSQDGTDALSSEYSFPFHLTKLEWSILFLGSNSCAT